MKKSIDIRAEISQNVSVINDLDSMIHDAKWSERTSDKIVKACAAREALEIENLILRDNARQALVKEVLPAIVDIWNKYAGKRYGERTKEKIINACKEAVNCSIYIDRHSTSDDLHIVPLNSQGFSGTYWRYDDFILYFMLDGKCASLLVDNVIQQINVDDFKLSNCSPYVDNVRERAELLLESFKYVQEMHKKFESACNDINKLLPSGIERMRAGYIRRNLRGRDF